MKKVPKKHTRTKTTALTPVIPAVPYNPSDLSSTGHASNMLLRQFNFPNLYEEGRDQLAQADHDRLMQSNYERVAACIERYTGSGEGALQSWFEKSSDQQIMTFIHEMLGADGKVVWTGYRVMGTVHRANGWPVWTLQLFAKHPQSQTKVYTGQDAPNVLQA